MEFSPGSAVRFGWETFKKRPWFFVGAAIVIFIAYAVVGAISSSIDAGFGGSAEEPTPIGGIVNFLLSIIVSMGVTAFYLAAHDNPDTLELSALWHPQPFGKFVIASILLWLTIAIGFVLLVIPGIIATIFFMFTTVIVIDKERGPVEAMKESMHIGRGNRWSLLGFIVLLLLINLLGVIAFGVGLLVTMPVTTLAFMHAYRTLSGSAGPAAVQDARLAA